MSKIWTLILLVLAGAWTAPAEADVMTVGTNGAAGADTNSIQGAINYLANIDPAKDADPNTYHTILIQAGTYSTNSGESFQTHTVFDGADGTGGRGRTGYASRSLITIDDVDGDMGHSTNSYLDGLHLIGAGVGQTILDAGTNAGTASRVLFIKNRDVVIQGMTLEHGNTTGGYWNISGASILSSSSGAIRLQDIKIADSTSGGDWNFGPVDIRGVDGAIFRNVEITGCVAGANGLSVLKVSGATVDKKAFFDRLNVHGNQAGGAAVSVWGRADVICNSLVTGTTKCGGNGGIGVTVNEGGDSVGPGVYVVNCTVADNAGVAISDGNYWGWSDYILNSIIADNGGSTAGNSASRMYCMHNVIGQSDWAWTTLRVDGYTTGAGDDGTNLLPPADPRFVNQAEGDYRLLPNSPAVDKIAVDGTGTSAFVLTGGTAPNQFVYVDVNKNGSYDPQLDVIVKLRGYTPGSNDWVSTTDRADRPRLRAQGLDAGCYEWQPPGGTVVTFK